MAEILQFSVLFLNYRKVNNDIYKVKEKIVKFSQNLSDLQTPQYVTCFWIALSYEN